MLALHSLAGWQVFDDSIVMHVEAWSDNVTVLWTSQIFAGEATYRPRNSQFLEQSSKSAIFAHNNDFLPSDHH